MNEKIKGLILEEMKKAYNNHFRIVEFHSRRRGTYGAQLTSGAGLEENIGVYLSTNWLGNKVKKIKDDYIFCVRNRDIMFYIDELVRPYMKEEYKVLFVPLSMYDTGTYNHAIPVNNILQKLDEWDEFLITTQGEITQEAMEQLACELDRQNFKFGVEISAKVNEEVYSIIEHTYFDEHEPYEIGTQYCDIQYDNGKHDIVQFSSE